MYVYIYIKSISCPWHILESLRENVKLYGTLRLSLCHPLTIYISRDITWLYRSLYSMNMYLESLLSKVTKCPQGWPKHSGWPNQIGSAQRCWIFKCILP